MAIWDVYQESTYMSKLGEDAQTTQGVGEIDDNLIAVGEELVKRFGVLGPDPNGKHTAFPYSVRTNPGEIIVKVMFTTDLNGKAGWFTDRWTSSPNNITSGDYIVQLRAVKRIV